MHMFQRAWVWLKWPVGLGLIAGLVWVNRHGLAQIYSNDKNWSFLVASVALVGCSALITFFRWYLLVKAQGFVFSFNDALRLGFTGVILSYLGPGAVGGDIAKAVILARGHKSRRAVAVSTILLDRILGLLGLFIVGSVAALLFANPPDIPQLKTATAILHLGTLAGFAGVGVMMIPGSTRWLIFRWVAHLPVVGRIAAELLNGVALYQTKPQVIVSAVVLSVLGHLGLITGFYLGARAMQPWSLDLATHFYFMPIAELAATVLPTPGGLGALEGAVQLFYQWLAPGIVTPAQAQAAGLNSTLVHRFATLVVAAAGFGYYLAARKEVAQALAENDQALPPALNDAAPMQASAAPLAG